MFLTESSLQQQIEDMVVSKRIDYLDALTLFLTQNELDAEDVKKLLSSNLKGKIRECAQEQGLMRKTAKLPL